ncbi:MAG TPA: hypothetical protein PKE06_12525 [Flavilitoribacter sp.]|nr:hypothetical protein [Flavilitoribacter sp.]HMQ88715.1 hypothetical protein [Flavilitoribacter sp.]
MTSGDPYKAIMDDPQFFLIKEGEKLKNADSVNMEKWLEDAPETLEKYSKGEFGNIVKDKKKGAVGKLFQAAAIQNQKGEEEILMKIVASYNAEKGTN